MPRVIPEAEAVSQLTIKRGDLIIRKEDKEVSSEG